MNLVHSQFHREHSKRHHRGSIETISRPDSISRRNVVQCQTMRSSDPLVLHVRWRDQWCRAFLLAFIIALLSHHSQSFRRNVLRHHHMSRTSQSNGKTLFVRWSSPCSFVDSDWIHSRVIPFVIRGEIEWIRWFYSLLRPRSQSSCELDDVGVVFSSRRFDRFSRSIRYLEKHISATLESTPSRSVDEREQSNGNSVTRSPIYVLCCIQDRSVSSIKTYPQSNYCVQCHSGTIRNFVEGKIGRKTSDFDRGLTVGFSSSRSFSSSMFIGSTASTNGQWSLSKWRASR